MTHDANFSLQTWLCCGAWDQPTLLYIYLYDKKLNFVNEKSVSTYWHLLNT
jgi:hypothetical protein